MVEQHLPEWLRRRAGENRDEWLIRTARSCYFCPHPAFTNAVAASNHEDVCADNPAVRRKRRA